MKAAALTVCLGLVVGTAPFQCASDPDPDRAMEDSAPRALWDLAERFREAGDAPGQRQTLLFLVDRYPSSRYTRRAELELGRSARDDPRDAPDLDEAPGEDPP